MESRDRPLELFWATLLILPVSAIGVFYAVTPGGGGLNAMSCYACELRGSPRVGTPGSVV